MANTFVDFNLVKQRVSMEAVLDHYNVHLRRVNQNSLRGLCPLPTHTSEKSKESFGVHVAKKIWSCQSSSCASARAGKKGGNILDFVAVMESCSVRDAAIKLSQWFSITPDGARTPEKTKLVTPEKEESRGVSEENKSLTFTLNGVDPTHGYLQQRGITEETARNFGVGFFPGRGTMNGRIVIPIHNKNGELVAYAGRAIDESEPKYKFPAGFRKSLVLFNLHRVLANISRQDVLIIVEGFFDCLKVWQSGSQNVIALMGCSLAEKQRTLLQPFTKIVLLLDGDQAGREGSTVIASQLLRSHFVKLASLPEGKQPDQMSPEELRALLNLLV